MSDERPVLPDVTDDETAVGWSEETEDDAVERLLRERPPHHDR